MSAQKKPRNDKSKYHQTVLAMSNICEPLFSAAKLILTDLIKNMDPNTVAMILFLKSNMNMWKNVAIIDEVIKEIGE